MPQPTEPPRAPAIHRRPLALDIHAASEIRAEMARQNLTYRQLAHMLGWSENQVARRIAGPVTRSPITLGELDQVAERLRRPISQFIDRGAAASRQARRSA